MREPSRKKPRGDQAESREDWGREPLHFDHGHLEPSPKDSQDRLFAARRQQAKRQRRREKREEKVKGFIVPLIVVAVIAGLLGVAGWRIWVANRTADAKVSRDRPVETKKEFVRPANPEAATEVEKARDRYLLRASDSPGSDD